MSRMDAAMARLDAVLNAPVPRRAPSREYLSLKAATIADVDAGTFVAVISSERPDREKDIVPASAMVRALQSWTGSGKKVPLHWNHSAKAEDIVGHIDPATVRAEGGEVVAEGWVDRSTPQGREAWRLVKSGTLGFSFGYLPLKSDPRDGGGRQIHELDVFEISCTSTPMNHDTRVTAWKATQALRAKDRDVPSLEELVRRERELFDDPEQVKLRAEAGSAMRAALGGEPADATHFADATQEKKLAAISPDLQDARARQYLAEFGHLLDD